MRPDDIPLLSMLRDSLGYHNARQRAIADNVANANTPGYTPSDIPRSEFERVLAGQNSGWTGLRTTDERHYGASESGSTRRYNAQAAPDSETTVNGNSVVIEEQMVRANENRMRFETALSLYQKSLNMIRLASRPPGQ